ncbi:MAG: erythromycin esterase family protein [Moraxellaceae bacterium]|nr:MAG: erythromycin esterase family protein [Moraxellaceae bacterium]
MTSFQQNILELIRESATPVRPTSNSQTWKDFSPLIEMVKDKSFILLGEATHGTHEFYEARVEITKRLIIDHGLNAIAIEGDWPSAYRVNKYVRWQGHDTNANDALADFKRFPMWMWRNTVILEFVNWLRKHNEGLPSHKQVGFYGLDMYSMYESVDAVLEYLDRVDPVAAVGARERYGCLDHVGNERHYGYGVTLGRHSSCEDEVVKQLIELRERSMAYASDELSDDDQFQAEQNAHLIKSAESYYRQMFDSWVNTWNLRDTHMIETLDNLHQYLSAKTNNFAKIASSATHHGSQRQII